MGRPPNDPEAKPGGLTPDEMVQATCRTRVRGLRPPTRHHGAACTKAGDSALQAPCGGFDSHLLHCSRAICEQAIIDNRIGLHRWGTRRAHASLAAKHRGVRVPGAPPWGRPTDKALAREGASTNVGGLRPVSPRGGAQAGMGSVWSSPSPTKVVVRLRATGPPRPHAA